MSKLDDYIRIDAEIDFYDATTHNLDYLIGSPEGIKEKGVGIHDFRGPLFKQAHHFLTEVHGKSDGLPEKLEQLDLNLLHVIHGLMIGVRLRYDYPVLNDKGEYILDSIWQHTTDGYNSDTFFSIIGRSYRKKGFIEKKITQDRIPFYAEHLKTSQKTSPAIQADKTETRPVS